MNHKEFEKKFPEIASHFGPNFWSKIEPEHPVKFNILRDNSGFFDVLSRLVDQTPTKKIASQYQNDLYDASRFKSFQSEMVGYIAIDRWLCSNPTVLDVQGTSGLPEFACKDFDVEIARLLESSEILRVRAWLEEELAGDCVAFVDKKDEYDDYASGKPAWDQNESQVEELMDKMDGIDREDIPLTVETNALRVKLEEGNTDNVGYLGMSSPTRIIPDEDEKIARTVKEKADKCRDDRPLVIFLDLDIQTVDTIREVIDKTIGERYGGDSKISKHVQNTDPIWDNYLEEVGIKPNSHTHGLPPIRPGDEGVFVKDEVSCIAGVLVRFYHKETAYVPNIYTDDVNAKVIYDQLGWGQNTRSLRSKDI